MPRRPTLQRLRLLSGALFLVFASSLPLVGFGDVSHSPLRENGVGNRVAEAGEDAGEYMSAANDGGTVPLAEWDEHAWTAAQRFLHGVRWVSGTCFTLLMILMLALSEIDRRHPRRLRQPRPISIVVPCYNDGESVTATVESVFRACPHDLVDLIVVNDCSTDDSLARIRGLAERFPIRVVDNERNKGKARSLNDVIPTALHELVLCLDADTLLNRPALADMVARMDADPRLGAVSSPYRPLNRGFLPTMQAIEYNMLLLTQGAHNVLSAMALWGGCLMVRKTAFLEAGGFFLNAITEDVDLAFRLNRIHWRVEQSFRPVRSLVPQTWRAWVRQKIRWTSGGMQCYIRHFRVWARNPIQIFFILSYSLLVASTLPLLFEGIAIGESIALFWNEDLTFARNFINLNRAFGLDVLRRLARAGLCCFFACIYIPPMIHRARDFWKMILALPYSLVYFPVYIVVSLFGTAKGIRSLIRPKAADTRAWRN